MSLLNYKLIYNTYLYDYTFMWVCTNKIKNIKINNCKTELIFEI